MNLRTILKGLGELGCVLVTSIGCSKAEPVQPGPRGTPGVKVIQPVQEYLFSFQEDTRAVDDRQTDLNPFRFYTHLGTDYGRMGPGEDRISWKPSRVEVDLTGWTSPQWAGMWHSLEGLARESNRYLDFLRCYPPFIRDEFQPRCVGVTVHAKGNGYLKLELKSPKDNAGREKLIWNEVAHFSDSADQIREFRFVCDPKKLRQVKFLNWVVDYGSRVSVDNANLVLEFPKLPLEKRIFLISYAKLARCYSPTDGIVKDRANFPAGDFDSVPASGMFCLATCAAWRAGIVDQKFARDTLHNVHRTVSRLPRASGLLPHFIRKYEGRYSIHHGTEYSAVDTSLYYHGMLLAAQMLADKEMLVELTRAVKEVRFDVLRNNEGWIGHGFKEDGRTKLDPKWRDWGGETALVLMLERMASGKAARMKMDKSGKVFGGVGFIAEIQSLFYPQFSQDVPDAISGVNWLQVRCDLLKEQMGYFPRNRPASVAAKLGLYGLSAGEGPRGVGYDPSGTQTADAKLLHPHYVLMSGLLRSPQDVSRTLQAMEAHGLVPPWGMVENFTSDVDEYLPMLGSLNAVFECLGAYHLWARAAGGPDDIHEAARTCTIMEQAIQAFYPRHP